MQETSIQKADTQKSMSSWRRFAWILILISGLGLLLWCAMAALAPEHLIGLGSTPILIDEDANFTENSWSDLTGTSPMAAGFVTRLFQMYCTYSVAFTLMAIAITVTAFQYAARWAWWSLLVGTTLAFVATMAYDWTMRALGLFELTEYLGLVAIYLALGFMVPWKGHFPVGRLGPSDKGISPK